MAMLTWPTPLVQSREVGDGRSLLKTRGPIACGGACRPRAWETDATARCTAKRAESEGDVPLPNAFATFVTDHPPLFFSRAVDTSSDCTVLVHYVLSSAASAPLSSPRSGARCFLGMTPPVRLSISCR